MCLSRLNKSPYSCTSLRIPKNKFKVRYCKKYTTSKYVNS